MFVVLYVVSCVLFVVVVVPLSMGSGQPARNKIERIRLDVRIKYFLDNKQNDNIVRVHSSDILFTKKKTIFLVVKVESPSYISTQYTYHFQN